MKERKTRLSIDIQPALYRELYAYVVHMLETSHRKISMVSVIREAIEEKLSRERGKKEYERIL